MNIAILGYGKMGKTIEEVAVSRGHKIVLTVNEENLFDFTKENLSKADAAIEFTGPDTAFDNIKQALEWGIPVVSGSTGWIDRLPEIETVCKKANGAFLYSSNFSIGVNIFFELNKKLAELMSAHKEYKVELNEIHHTQKKDKPSGTAITLAEQIIERVTSKQKWVNEESSDEKSISILSQRIDPAPGTHMVKYTSPIDDIEIIHTAHSRTGFATGAILSAEFIKGKTGIFGMKEVLNFDLPIY